MIEKLKSSKDSNNGNETVGQKLSQFRNKLNEIIDYINQKDENEQLRRLVEELVSDEVDNDVVIVEEDE